VADPARAGTRPARRPGEVRSAARRPAPRSSFPWRRGWRSRRLEVGHGHGRSSRPLRHMAHGGPDGEGGSSSAGAWSIGGVEQGRGGDARRRAAADPASNLRRRRALFLVDSGRERGLADRAPLWTAPARPVLAAAADWLLCSSVPPWWRWSRGAAQGGARRRRAGSYPGCPCSAVASMVRSCLVAKAAAQRWLPPPSSLPWQDARVVESPSTVAR
jgi:hypothetical protein